MIPSWYLALQNICGEQLASNNADAGIATHSGSLADGDAGVDADTTYMTSMKSFMQLDHRAFVANPWGQPGNLGMMPMDFDDDLNAFTTVSTLPGRNIFYVVVLYPEDERSNT